MEPVPPTITVSGDQDNLSSRHRRLRPLADVGHRGDDDRVGDSSRARPRQHTAYGRHQARRPGIEPQGAHPRAGVPTVADLRERPTEIRPSSRQVAG